MRKLKLREDRSPRTRRQSALSESSAGAVTPQPCSGVAVFCIFSTCYLWETQEDLSWVVSAKSTHTLQLTITLAFRPDAF